MLNTSAAEQLEAKGLNTMADCTHELDFHWEQRESDPLHPGDNNPTIFMVAICDECDEDITDLVGDYDPDIDTPDFAEAI